MTPCINWSGSKDVYGYGRFKKEGKTYKAHRVAYEKAHGVSLIPKQHICHKCDNPSCVNPDHLFLGDGRANALDRHSKSRDASGTRHGMHKLSRVDVERIRDISRLGGCSAYFLGKMFKVSATQVRSIVAGRQRVNG